MSKTTENHDELNLSKEIIDLSGKLQKELTVDKEGNITPDKDLYSKLLPEGLTMDTVTAVQKHHGNLVAAAAHAVGTIGTKFLEKHSKVTDVHMEKLHMGRDQLRVNLARQANVPGLGGKATTHHGYLSAKYTSASAGTSGAAFKRIRTHFSSEGAKLFGEAK